MSQSDITHGTYYLKEDLKTPLSEITELIQKNHPGKKLEEFLAHIFKNVPNTIDVKLNGSQWGTDNGADIIVTYLTGLPIVEELKQESTLVVQIKSFTGVHTETNAVEQIKIAMEKYNADCGLIITTAKPSDRLIDAIEKLQKTLKNLLV